MAVLEAISQIFTEINELTNISAAERGFNPELTKHRPDTENDKSSLRIMSLGTRTLTSFIKCKGADLMSKLFPFSY